MPGWDGPVVRRSGHKLRKVLVPGSDGNANSGSAASSGRLSGMPA
jgi:hypothetical protein